MSDPQELDTWAEQAILTALEERVPFHVAASYYLPNAMTFEQGQQYQRRKAFREAWARISREFYKSKSSGATHDKSILTGKMLAHAEALSQAGKLKDAADVLAQVAKIEGWTGPESTTHIYQSLTGSDFEQWRQDIAERRSRKEHKVN